MAAAPAEKVEYEEEPVTIAGSWRGSGLLKTILDSEVDRRDAPSGGDAELRPAEPGPKLEGALSGVAQEAPAPDELEPLVGDVIERPGPEPVPAGGRKRRRRRRRGGEKSATAPSLHPEGGGAAAGPPATGVVEPVEEPAPEVTPRAGVRQGLSPRRDPEPHPVRRRRLSSPKAWSFGPTHWGPRATASADEILNPPPRKKRRNR